MAQILSEPAPRAAKKKRPKAQLLLVDDNKELSRIVKECLERENYQVAWARDGEEGLNLARKHKPELIILDIVMPKMDGMGFLKALRQESQVPVLVLTGKHGDMNQVLGFKLGADDFVFKPVCAEVLIARVEAILKRAAAANAADDKGIKRRSARRYQSY
jgi:DNA-binding response OmpR family regulator